MHYDTPQVYFYIHKALITSLHTHASSFCNFVRHLIHVPHTCLHLFTIKTICSNTHLDYENVLLFKKRFM